MTARLLLLKTVKKKSAQVELLKTIPNLVSYAYKGAFYYVIEFFRLIINFAVHCVWNDWTMGDCSVTCGEGTRTNTRTQNETAQFGGDECDGSTSAIENCKEQECPGRNCLK